MDVHLAVDLNTLVSLRKLRPHLPFSYLCPIVAVKAALKYDSAATVEAVKIGFTYIDEINTSDVRVNGKIISRRKIQHTEHRQNQGCGRICAPCRVAAKCRHMHKKTEIQSQSEQKANHEV